MRYEGNGGFTPPDAKVNLPGVDLRTRKVSRAPVASEPNWNQAACRTEDPELFFPVGTSGPALQQTMEALRVCKPCPVRTECLEWALDSGQDSGVWGGTSEDERRRLKRADSVFQAPRSES